jgi:hypothetical protein
MWGKVKSNVLWILAAIAGIATALLFRQSRKTEKAEAELASSVAKTEIKLNDKDREYAHSDTEAAVADYLTLKREYDENRTGGGS